MTGYEDKSRTSRDFGLEIAAEVSLYPYNLDISYPTDNLIANYRRACDLASVDGYARMPEDFIELESVDRLKSTYASSIKYNLEQLIANGRFERAQIENTVGPCRSFIHSERVIYQGTHLPADITFVAEMTNKANEWVNFSPFGWVRHSDGPVFTQVSAPLRDPWRFRSELLYSEAAFAEELAAIRAAPMEFVLGFAGRSFLVETAFHHLVEKLRPRPIYHSSITSFAITQTSDSTVEVTATLPEAGTCEVHLSYDRETAKVSVNN